MKCALFLFLVFILEGKYGLSVSSLIRLVSCIGLGLKFCAFGALMCVYEFRCVVNLLDLGVAVTGPGRCKRDGIEVKIRSRRSDLGESKVGDRSRMEREQIILKSLTQGQERQITRGIP